MGPVSLLVDAVSDAFEVRRETVNAYARALIDEGLLPKARGRAVPDVEPVHIARLMIAVALAPKIKDAGETVRRYTALQLTGIPESMPDHLKPEKLTAERALTDIVRPFTDPVDTRPSVDDTRIELVESWPEIAVYDKHEQLIARYSEPGEGMFWRSHLRRAAKFGTHAILSICAFMATHNQAGEE